MNRTLVLIPTVCLTAIGAGWLWHELTTDDMGESGVPITQSPHNEPADRQPVDESINQNLQLHPKVKLAVSKEPIGVAARKDAIELMPMNLSPHDLDALFSFMNAERPADVPLSSWHGLVDQLVDTLQHQEKAPAGLTSALICLFEDSEDLVLRDYAIQYLRSWYADRSDFYKHEPDPEARGKILDTLVKAASHTDKPYSGTAIMALNDAFRSEELKNEPETQKQLQAHMEDYSKVLVEIVKDPKTNKLCKISTIQICAMRGMIEILPAARQLAADPSVDPNIRISAIAAIGQLGSMEEDGELLKSLSDSGVRFSYAAVPALEKLTSR